MNNGIYYWDVDPVIFWITDSFPLKYYGLFFVTGILLAYYVVKQIYKKENVPEEELDKLLIYVVIGTIVGARLGHVLFYEPAYYFSNPLEIFFPVAEVNGSYKFVGIQGLASHGGSLGVFIAIVLYSRKYKTRLCWILDRVVIGAPITAAFIRLGNFMNSEIYGKPTSGNWGVVFQREDLIPRHPTQLYEAISYLLIFMILYYVYNREQVKKFKGRLFGIFLILLFSARLVIEFFKENQVGFEEGLTLNMGQLLSIPFIMAGLFLIFVQSRFVGKKL